jgi:Tfp pilus assembly protein PilV
VSVVRPPASRGSSVAEALVAAALAGVALAALALVARLAGTSLRQARDTSAALALAEEQLETLRLGPRADGSDGVEADGVTFARAWRVTGGRGRTTRVAVDVVWGGHRVALDAGMLP